MQPTMITNENGDTHYRLNGEYHREDGPAIIYTNGSQYWYLNGKWHREDGPAIIDTSGTQIWCINGQNHREDGPAVTWPSGKQDWWINDIEYSFNDFCKQLKLSEEDITFLKLKYNTCVTS